jgi:hypothetical protein
MPPTDGPSIRNSQVPEDPKLVDEYFDDMTLRITRVLSLSPSHISSLATDEPFWPIVHHIDILDENLCYDILFALPEACKFIQKGMDCGRVLVHSPMESRAVFVLCAFREYFPCVHGLRLMH